MVTHGRLSEYSSAEDWVSYVERMDNIFWRMMLQMLLSSERYY